jgi:hypothetical protein
MPSVQKHFLQLLNYDNDFIVFLLYRVCYKVMACSRYMRLNIPGTCCGSAARYEYVTVGVSNISTVYVYQNIHPQ